MADLISAKKSQRSPHEKPWWWITGDTYPQRELLKLHGARFSKRRRAWYFIGPELPAAIQALTTVSAPEVMPATADDDPCSVETAASLLGMSVKPLAVPPVSVQVDDMDQTASPKTLEPTDEKAPKVRVTKPTPFPLSGDPLDAVQSAIQTVKTAPLCVSSAAPAASGKLKPIGQAYCGELTGSVSGQVFCYGYAIHNGVCVYLNMGGPRVSVEAIRAKLGKGDIVTLVPEDAPGLELTAGEGNSGMYTDYLQTIPEARFTSLILLHDWVIHPNYNGAATTFLIRTSDAQAKAKLKQHILQLVNIPVFDDWIEFLWNAGQAAALVRPTNAEGGIDLLTLSLDATAWTRLITSGVEQQIIRLPAIS